MARRPFALIAALVALVSGCGGSQDGDRLASAETRSDAKNHGSAPNRFTIVPDDYHVPYAGTAEDGRKFFLSDELFDFDSRSQEPTGYVGLFLWNADGTFSEVRVDRVSRPDDVPPDQAASANSEEVVKKRLGELGKYKLEPITVEPFMQNVDGVPFGWKVGQYEDSEYHISIVPGDFIVYYEPWDGHEYDT